MAQLIHHFKQSQFNNSTGFTAQTPASFNLFCLNHLVGEAQPGRLLALHFVLPAQPCHQGLTSGDHILCPLTPPLSCADIQLRELCIIQKIHFSEAALTETAAEMLQIKHEQVTPPAAASKVLNI